MKQRRVAMGMKGLTFAVGAAVTLGFVASAEPVKVIFDTDMLTDFDDVGALACLHAMADAGECEILATVSCTRGNASVGAIQIINTYYGRGDLPVGCTKGMGVWGCNATRKPRPECKADELRLFPKLVPTPTPGSDGGHAKYLRLLKDYPGWYSYADSDDAPDANDVYRRILSEQPDGSVVICSVGFLTNLRRLLETKGDRYSPLDGKALVAKKVKRWVAMALKYPKGKEYNSMMDPESSRIVLENWPTEIVISDWEFGFDIFAGRCIAEMAGPRNPVKDVFAGNIPSREEIRRDSAKWLRSCFGMGGRSAWDETAVLVAVRGADRYCYVERGTYRMIGDDGENEWAPGEDGRHLRIQAKISKARFGELIDELICRPPLRTQRSATPKGSVSRPGAFHRAERRAHVGIPSIAVSPVNGRLWATWYNGEHRGEDLYNYVTLVTSADGGRSWKEVLVADPDGAGPKRSFDPELWIAPDGKLRWSWTERLCDPKKGDPKKDFGLDIGDPKTDVVMMATLSAEDEPTLPVATVPVARGVMMCKPTVLANGEWLLPVSHWYEEPSACFYVSSDNGRTFECRGGVTLPKEARLYDEHQVVERANGDLVAYIRTKSHPKMSVSHDRGRTWTAPERPPFDHTSSRVFFRKLRSGTWLLVKHGPVGKDVGRRELTAYVSKDEGLTWTGGLLLDARSGVSYPDGQQLPDGSVVVIYDRNRVTDREILFATFTEADVLAGGDVSGKVRLRQVITAGNVLR